METRYPGTKLPDIISTYQDESKGDRTAEVYRLGSSYGIRYSEGDKHWNGFYASRLDDVEAIAKDWVFKNPIRI